MKSYYKMIKRWDIIIVFSLILLSFLPFVIFSYVQSINITKASVKVAIISVNNKEIDRILLTNHTGIDIFDVYDDDGGLNTIEVNNGRIRIKGADCGDQICVLTGFIYKPGETIICLPHKLVIEIQSVEGSSDEVIISS